MEIQAKIVAVKKDLLMLAIYGTKNRTLVYEDMLDVVFMLEEYFSGKVCNIDAARLYVYCIVKVKDPTPHNKGNFYMISSE